MINISWTNGNQRLLVSFPMKCSKIASTHICLRVVCLWPTPNRVQRSYFLIQITFGSRNNAKTAKILNFVARKFAHSLLFVKAKALEKWSIWLISMKLIKQRLSSKSGTPQPLSGQKKAKKCRKLMKNNQNWLNLAKNCLKITVQRVKRSYFFTIMIYLSRSQ